MLRSTARLVCSTASAAASRLASALRTWDWVAKPEKIGTFKGDPDARSGVVGADEIRVVQARQGLAVARAQPERGQVAERAVATLASAASRSAPLRLQAGVLPGRGGDPGIDAR